MEQIVLAYGITKKSVAVIKNTKVKVRSPDGNSDFFDIVAGVFQGDTLGLYVFVIYLNYVLWTSIDLIKENGFTLKRARNRRYTTQITTDPDYADDIALLANTPTQEHAAGCIDLDVNADEMG